MKKSLLIEICSDLDFEGMVVDISLGHQVIAEINYDKGIDNMEIEILPSGSESSEYVIPLKDFLEVLEKAKEIAIRCAKEGEEMRQ